ncbi:hypothetical protein B0H19DRAFT_1180070 [Mycena capillaripes]|nr:hypothetical protein B0H19DRAFT_1180070 [Mycena capillaripes]
MEFNMSVCMIRVFGASKRDYSGIGRRTNIMYFGGVPLRRLRIGHPLTLVYLNAWVIFSLEISRHIFRKRRLSE